MNLEDTVKHFKDLKNGFHPKFSSTSSLAVVARMINEPHIDDAPQLSERISRTFEMIRLFCDMKRTEITWWDTRAIHSYLWNRLNPKRIHVGDFRKCNVQVGMAIMPKHEFLEDLIGYVFPVSLSSLETKEEIIDWYRMFEALHPFEDGNGRVGGVIVAILSFSKFGYYLAPHQ